MYIGKALSYNNNKKCKTIINLAKRYIGCIRGFKNTTKGYKRSLEQRERYIMFDGKTIDVILFINLMQSKYNL